MDIIIRSTILTKEKNQFQSKTGATACRAWPRAETSNSLKKVLQILLNPRAYNLVNLPSLSSGYFNENSRDK